MRFFILFITLFIYSCASKFQGPVVNKAPIVNKTPTVNDFHTIDLNKDLSISGEEYQKFIELEYNSQDPAIWFLVILFFVFLFSVFLAYIIKRK